MAISEARQADSVPSRLGARDLVLHPELAPESICGLPDIVAFVWRDAVQIAQHHRHPRVGPEVFLMPVQEIQKKTVNGQASSPRRALGSYRQPAQ